ncbi:hypothetical protein B0H17DRAFT_1210565 [Mycena rosella]|uniref:Extracellular membrane protein CFEM domain-containing protein n=1 Tax=Mycena rosella TaxID=1033263 RepID=A0AAD7CVY2_MYCRO|nr:hypothetical protein B0H17DRAFT_1210565 [Mycena rosella]
MFLRTTAIVLGSLYLVQTVAGGPSSVRRIQGLNSRSLPAIPAACQAGCEPFTPFLAGATCPVTECCTAIFEQGYFKCFSCVGSALKATDFSVAQEYVDVLTTSCLSEGFTLPELTFPGQNPGRTLATALPAGASNIPIFASGSPVMPSSSVVRPHSTTPTPTRSAHTGTTTVSHSGASQIPGSASSKSSAAGSSVSVSQASAPAGSQSSTTVPVSQSTATSPSSVSSGASTLSSVSFTGAPAPTNPPSAAFRPRARFEAVAFLVALIALHGLLA